MMNETCPPGSLCTICFTERDDLFADNAASALRQFDVDWDPTLTF